MQMRGQARAAGSLQITWMWAQQRSAARPRRAAARPRRHAAGTSAAQGQTEGRRPSYHAMCSTEVALAAAAGHGHAAGALQSGVAAAVAASSLSSGDRRAGVAGCCGVPSHGHGWWQAEDKHSNPASHAAPADTPLPAQAAQQPTRHVGALLAP
ncbi:hypothetical protein ABPG75_000493 [Micractinium tetrahymenae]